MKTGIPTNGSMVKNHISSKTGFGFSATRRTSFLLWFQACQIRVLDLTHKLRRHFQDRGVITQHLLPARLHHFHQVKFKTREREDRIESDISRVTVSTMVDERSGRPDIDQANINLKPNKKEPKRDWSDPLFADSGRASSEIPEWLQEFRENVVDDEIPLQEGSHASSSHEVSLEPMLKRREDLDNHCVSTHST